MERKRKDDTIQKETAVEGKDLQRGKEKHEKSGTKSRTLNKEVLDREEGDGEEDRNSKIGNSSNNDLEKQENLNSGGGGTNEDLELTEEEK